MCLKFTEADVTRFLALVDKLPNGCWFFTGGRSRGGGKKGKLRRWYGSFWLPEHGTVRAHKFAAVALGSGFTEGNHLDHTCCFTLCVNPDHLEDVSPPTNQERRLARIREAKLRRDVTPRR